MFLFDLDGTLIDSNHVWEEIDLAFLNKRKLPWSKEYHAGVVHASFPTAAAFTKAFCHLPDSPEEIMAEWLDMAYHAYREEIPLKEGVRPFLEQTAASGQRMAIYTSCERPLCEAALTHHNLTHYFEQVIYSSELGVEKRSPAAFSAVLSQLECRASDCRFFDDSPLSCAAAKKAGCHVTGVFDPLFAEARTEMEQLCDNYIDSFLSLIH